ncbi:AAA family ATPase [Leptothermofonsia sichuanensis E412]|uniref:ATP-binding cassette domain-containing protein n=1 Tax=Leptothermofonsia sichuanensis TaxID=2917832 RepID=UPI001CA60A57|nr:ATP-binding cassette domain-containing protein [Leptothermofonsia sichuanensis]QZZ21728.1 AAA family ATPase [Leptothermofonsia sichuanensis E412]
MVANVKQGRRIVIIGSSGSGKTTLAREIARKLTLPHIELDALHWEANWTEASFDQFKTRVENSLQTDGWVVDGNYSKVRDLIWLKADTLIWLDYSFPVVFGRVVQRTFWRAISQQELWNGNRETWQIVFSHNSMILWVLRTYWQRQREWTLLCQQPEYAHLQIIRFSSPKATRQWLEAL